MKDQTKKYANHFAKIMKQQGETDYQKFGAEFIRYSDLVDGDCCHDKLLMYQLNLEE